MLFRVPRLTASSLLHVNEKETPMSSTYGNITSHSLKEEACHLFLHCEKEPSCHRKITPKR